MVFVRNGLPESLCSEELESLFCSGRLSWFHMSSEAELIGTSVESRYMIFIDYFSKGLAKGYADSWADAFGWHGGKKDHHFCSTQQWHYWRLLSDLNMGISYIALY